MKKIIVLFLACIVLADESKVEQYARAAEAFLSSFKSEQVANLINPYDAENDAGIILSGLSDSQKEAFKKLDKVFKIES